MLEEPFNDRFNETEPPGAVDAEARLNDAL